MKIFISWAGDLSHRVALCWREWLPTVITDAEPFVSDTDLPKGRDAFAEVLKSLAEADAGIICVTPSNTRAPWLLFEMGALASRPDAKVLPFLVGVRARGLPSPLAGFTPAKPKHDDVLSLLACLQEGRPRSAWRSRFETNWPELERKIAPLVKFAQAERAPVVRASDGVYQATVVSSPPTSVGDGIRSSWKNGRLIDSKYLYISDSGVDHWVGMCHDQSALREIGRRFWSGQAHEVAGAVTEAFGSTRFTFVSLGPGDGSKDAMLLRHWRKAAAFYVPLDISPRMLSYALQEIATRTDGKFAPTHVIYASWWDLSKAEPALRRADGPRLYSLLGNAIGNCESEQRLLELLHDMARPEDLLLLEVRQVGEWEAADSADLASKRFRFGPLDYLGVPFEPAHLAYKLESDFGDFPGTRTTVACYGAPVDGRYSGYPEARLEYIHEYDGSSFAAQISEFGWRVLRQFGSSEDRYLTFLCAKLPH